jgi:hypothetical protein
MVFIKALADPKEAKDFATFEKNSLTAYLTVIDDEK